MQLLARHRAEDLVAFGRAGNRTAGQLCADARAVRARLPDSEPGQDVLVVTEDRYHFAVALVACALAGKGVALPPNSQDAVIRSMAASPAISTLLHDHDESIGIDIRPSLGGASSSRRAPIEVDPAARFAVVHTSGTTGDASAHPKTASQLVGEAQTLAAHFQVGPGARLVATVPAHHIYGLLFSILVPLVGGGAFCRETPLHAQVVAATSSDAKARILVSVPAHLRALRLLDAMPPLDLVLSSGAPLMPEVAADLLERFGLPVTEVLGSTETGGMAFRRSDGDGAWTPLPGVELSADPVGRLLVDSPFLAPGAPRPHRSEDRVHVREDGRLEHLGRMDDVVKVAGKRVALRDIDRHLRAVPGVEDVAVGALEVGGARGVEPLAIVVAPGMTPELLRAALARHLDPVVVPRRLRIVPGIARDARGKLSRARLLEIYEQAATAPTELTVGEVTTERAGDVVVHRVSLTAPRDLTWFRGHFASFPLLPGVVQLELASEHARQAWDDLRRLGRVVKLKFKRPIRPGDTVMLELRRKSAQAKVSFEFGTEGGLASCGVLDFGPRERA